MLTVMYGCISPLSPFVLCVMCFCVWVCVGHLCVNSCAVATACVPSVLLLCAADTCLLLYLLYGSPLPSFVHSLSCMVQPIGWEPWAGHCGKSFSSKGLPMLCVPFFLFPNASLDILLKPLFAPTTAQYPGLTPPRRAVLPVPPCSRTCLRAGVLRLPVLHPQSGR